MNNTNLIDKTTILDAVVEFRLIKRLPIEDVFFAAKTVLEGFEYDKEQTMELPIAIRESDPKLKYAPYYKFFNESITIRISPQMLSFSVNGIYPGWSKFKEQITKNCTMLIEKIPLWKMERVSIRYVDFFKDIDIFKNISINVDNPTALCGNNFVEKRKNYVLEFLCKYDTEAKLQIVNNLILPTTMGDSQEGSIIDTDVFSGNVSDYTQTLEQIHEVAKATFFNILDEDFIKKSHLEQ